MQTNILEYLEHSAECYPKKTAYADDDYELTFEELKHKAQCIGSALAHRNSVMHRPVAVYMRRSPLVLAVCFGIVYAGGCYVVLDEEMPTQRIRLILESLQTDVLICDEETKERTADFAFEGNLVPWKELAGEPFDEQLLSEVRLHSVDTDPVYICFTSGSTGVPKGVVGNHHALINYIEQLSKVLGFSESCVFGNQTPLHVDACMKEIYGTLKCGGTTWLIPKPLFLHPVKLVEYLNEHRINTICWVASALSMLSAFGTFELVKPEYLRLVTFGSEVFPVRQFNIWKKALPQAEFYNLYGPTESTGVCCYYHVERFLEEQEAIPIGRPFKNMDVFLLDADGRQAQTGEICVRGPGITKGYFGNREKTAEVFTQNPLCPWYMDTIYHTGDMGYMGEDGFLYFASRKDHQIKHMGHRIELGEIEANANLIEGIQACCCVYVKEKLVLFYAGEPDKKKVLVALKERLPQYMIPNAVLKEEHLPRLTNGKLDRKRMEGLYLEHLAAKRGSRRRQSFVPEEQNEYR